MRAGGYTLDFEASGTRHLLASSMQHAASCPFINRTKPISHLHLWCSIYDQHGCQYKLYLELKGKHIFSDGIRLRLPRTTPIQQGAYCTILPHNIHDVA
jgi:hypothetical protein